MRPPYEMPQIVAELMPASSSARSICAMNVSKPSCGSMRDPLPGSPASEKLRTRNVLASSTTVGRAHSQRPCIPGISTSGHPRPTSIISFCSLFVPFRNTPTQVGTVPRSNTVRDLILQRLARLQRVGDALEGFSLAAQPDERLALQVEQVLL